VRRQPGERPVRASPLNRPWPPGSARRAVATATPRIVGTPPFFLPPTAAKIFGGVSTPVHAGANHNHHSLCAEAPKVRRLPRFSGSSGVSGGLAQRPETPPDFPHLPKRHLAMYPTIRHNARKFAAGCRTQPQFRHKVEPPSAETSQGHEDRLKSGRLETNRRDSPYSAGTVGCRRRTSRRV
jgi:hypothetical protein